MATKLSGFKKRFSLSLRLLAISILIFFVISFIIICNFSFSEQPSSSSFLQKNIEELDDYDAACSGYSIGRILREQKRILASVREELAETKVKIEEIRTVQEELQKLIPQKQLELSSLEGEIEAAQRHLEELRETQNVKVFLPHSPNSISQELLPKSLLPPDLKAFDLESIIDYSRCSITSFMPVYVDMVTSGQLEKEWKEIFRESVLNIVEEPNDACICIRISNGVSITNSYNNVIFNIGEHIDDLKAKSIIVQKSPLRSFDFAVDPSHASDPNVEELHPLLPLKRENLISLIIEENQMMYDVSALEYSANISNAQIAVVKCSKNKDSCSRISRRKIFGSTVFCFLFPSDDFLTNFLDSLQLGCVPVIFSNTNSLPFDDLIDWRRATYRLPLARLPESHFIVKSFENSDVLEMRRNGRMFYETYFASRLKVAKSLMAALRYKLQIPTKETGSSRLNRAVPLFHSSFTAPKGASVNVQPNFDDEYLLGPLESRVQSTAFVFNFTEFQMYSYEVWNSIRSPYRSKEFIINAAELPAESEFYEDTKIGFRPIEPGSGVEFSKALGGNRQREQFTIVLLTYERDAVLTGALERLHQLPYLNKIIVVWNNVHRDPPDTWPSLNVPVEFIRVETNSLNNRFVPWDRIETEAILSLDDDIDLMQQEIVLAFRVWRENRDRIVGFPARYHARYGESMFYNSNHTCQMSMILTGAAFIHKNYLTAYTYEMQAAIREHVDNIKNCEDIAMNYLVSHLTRKPPIKTTSRWTLKCPTCSESLFKEDSHFEKRHECMRLFTKIYGYNPLRFSQFRVDSILFKTRIPQNHQKCFKYV